MPKPQSYIIVEKPSPAELALAVSQLIDAEIEGDDESESFVYQPVGSIICHPAPMVDPQKPWRFSQPMRLVELNHRYPQVAPRLSQTQIAGGPPSTLLNERQTALDQIRTEMEKAKKPDGGPPIPVDTRTAEEQKASAGGEAQQQA